uniref:Uncharacterized protein n=1 Tax=Gloeothece verrucosa (strain PCC 7822) TaxID=497965 RepID=E0UD80_GLOV7|nr:hypothetical protein Cyan7822_0946 [Gloeothece verrucosa PCC 7822]
MLKNTFTLLLCHNKNVKNLRLAVKEEKVLKLKQQRTDIVSVRFLPEEKEKLAQIAAQRNITVSGLVRLNALAQSDNSHIKFVPEVNRKLYFELGKVAEKLQENELNNDSLNSLYSLLNEVRKELIGIKPAPRSALNQ